MSNPVPSSILPTDAVTMVDGHVYTTSLAIAKVFDRKHYNVLRDIKSLNCSAEFHALNFECMSHEVTIGNGATRTEDCYRITRDGLTILAFGYTGRLAMQFKEAYIRRFNELEQTLLNRPAIPELTEAKALLSEADRRLTAIQRVKRDAKRALIENTARDHELAALRQAYTGATTALTDAQREAQAARDLAIAGHADLRRVLHYRRKDLDTHEIHLLTTLPEAAIEDLLTQATAAGFHPELSDDLDNVVQMARNGLVMLPPAPPVTATEVQL